MSAPRTDLETQKRRHIGPLLGMALVVIFGVGVILYWLMEEASQGDGPGEEVSVEVPLSPEVAPAPQQGQAPQGGTQPAIAPQGN